jgi:hypothetical protein
MGSDRASGLAALGCAGPLLHGRLLLLLLRAHASAAGQARPAPSEPAPAPVPTSATWSASTASPARQPSALQLKLVSAVRGARASSALGASGAGGPSRSTATLNGSL